MSDDMSAEARKVLVGWALALAAVWAVDVAMLLKWVWLQSLSLDPRELSVQVAAALELMHLTLFNYFGSMLLAEFTAPGTFSDYQLKLLTMQKSRNELRSDDFTAEADTAAKSSLKYRNWLF